MSAPLWHPEFSSCASFVRRVQRSLLPAVKQPLRPAECLILEVWWSSGGLGVFRRSGGLQEVQRSGGLQEVWRSVAADEDLSALETPHCFISSSFWSDRSSSQSRPSSPGPPPQTLLHY
ncbi:unnamed protein product [Arctogadus glacialis]